MLFRSLQMFSKLCALFPAHISCKDTSGISYACIFLNKHGNTELLYFPTDFQIVKRQPTCVESSGPIRFGYNHLGNFIPMLAWVRGQELEADNESVF